MAWSSEPVHRIEVEWYIVFSLQSERSEYISGHFVAER